MNMDAKAMAEDMGHCGSLASSALSWAAERSSDIDVPIVATLIMLKILCEENIKKQLELAVPLKMRPMIEKLGMDPDTIKIKAYESMESLIKEYLSHVKRKEVKL